MLNDSTDLGHGTIHIKLTDVGDGEVEWTAFALPAMGRSYVAWHLDGHVTVGDTTREFENLMMDNNMTPNTINLLMKKDQKAQSYIVSAVAEYTGLDIELSS